MQNNSYENELNLHVNENSFSYERMGTKTRFENEASGNSEMACWGFCPRVPVHKNRYERTNNVQQLNKG